MSFLRFSADGVRDEHVDQNFTETDRSMLVNTKMGRSGHAIAIYGFKMGRSERTTTSYDMI